MNATLSIVRTSDQEVTITLSQPNRDDVVGTVKFSERYDYEKQAYARKVQAWALRQISKLARGYVVMGTEEKIETALTEGRDLLITIDPTLSPDRIVKSVWLAA